VTWTSDVRRDVVSRAQRGGRRERVFSGAGRASAPGCAPRRRGGRLRHRWRQSPTSWSAPLGSERVTSKGQLTTFMMKAVRVHHEGRLRQGDVGVPVWVTFGKTAGQGFHDEGCEGFTTATGGRGDGRSGGDDTLTGEEGDVRQNPSSRGLQFASRASPQLRGFTTDKTAGQGVYNSGADRSDRRLRKERAGGACTRTLRSGILVLPVALSFRK
jgi:hypothetical protein